jgi:hypothetical protein
VSSPKLTRQSSAKNPHASRSNTDQAHRSSSRPNSASGLRVSGGGVGAVGTTQKIREQQLIPFLEDDNEKSGAIRIVSPLILSSPSPLPPSSGATTSDLSPPSQEKPPSPPPPLELSVAVTVGKDCHHSSPIANSSPLSVVPRCTTPFLPTTLDEHPSNKSNFNGDARANASTANTTPATHTSNVSQSSPKDESFEEDELSLARARSNVPIQSAFFKNVSKVSVQLRDQATRVHNDFSSAPSSSSSSFHVAKDATTLRRQRLGFTLGPSTADDEPETPKNMTREDAILHGKRLLTRRLDGLHVKQHEMRDDGNCLFRAFSHQFFGTPDHHEHFRKRACQRLLEHRDMYSILFDTPQEYQEFVNRMQQTCIWGDEIVLKALCDHFEVVVYVILSTPGNWYLRYVPNQDNTTVRRMKKIFLSYLSPIHYNSVTYMDNSSITLFPDEEDVLPELKSARPS